MISIGDCNNTNKGELMLAVLCFWGSFVMSQDRPSQEPGMVSFIFQWPGTRYSGGTVFFQFYAVLDTPVHYKEM